MSLPNLNLFMYDRLISVREFSLWLHSSVTEFEMASFRLQRRTAMRRFALSLRFYYF